MQDEMDGMIPAPAMELQGKLSPTASATAVLGGPATGKTQALADRVRALLDGGADPAQIAVFSATPNGAQALASRLADAGAGAVHVQTPRRFFIDLLQNPQVETIIGRHGRLLAPYEMSFLLEDLKVSGIQPKRLREMTKFFFKSLTMLADRDPKWLITKEEQFVFGMVRDCLTFMNGFAEYELANLAHLALETDADVLAATRVEHVLVDNYQLLSRASQMALSLVAGSSITIAADEHTCFEAFESYPYAEGVSEFLAANTGANVVRLQVSHAAPCAAHASHALRVLAQAEEADEPATAAATPTTKLDVLARETPFQELDAAADYVADLVRGGMPRASIVVAPANRVWTKNIVAALAARDIAAEVAPSAQAVAGDVRDNKKCVAARAMCALLLAANDEDAAAWRAWVGFGDWLTNSGAVSGLLDRARGAEELKLPAVLEQAARRTGLFEGMPDELPPSAQRVMDAYEAGAAFAQKAAGLKGDALLDAIAQAIGAEGKDALPPAFLRLVAPLPDGSLPADDAASLAARALGRLEEPAFEPADAVRIAPYGEACMLDAQAVVLCGFLNGFFPIRDYFDGVAMPPAVQEQRRIDDALLLSSVVSRAQRALAASYFTDAPLETAEVLNLRVHRVRIQDGKRMARLEPSLFLDVMEGEVG